MLRLSEVQSNWLQTATPDEVQAFLAKGPAHTVSMMCIKEQTLYQAPAIRGLPVAFDRTGIKGAMTVAEETLAKLREQSPNLPVLDEVALGIDDTSERLMDDLENVMGRIETIFHLGTMLAQGIDELPGELRDWVTEGEAERALVDLDKQLPGLRKRLKAWRKEAKENGERFDDDMLCEAVMGYFYETGRLGFLVQARVSVVRPDGSMLQGNYRERWFYGETFEQAVVQSAGWCQTWRHSDDIAMAAHAATKTGVQ
jgi:hypothetical protein